ncbi:hypothetical protein [Melghirimyces algeriensis]|uniref:SHOCT domain-containing protein n=1 Tax=Melghirimyces algeriensis TaxID=910412 RepID=A0A521F7A3_9BACL|nr:hypothetical protein [Melghirimyces algeriensis]SMO92062.1 hypothetical protein SAMN06264849_11419 [Melghirimyces algeriensis]
MPTLIERYYAGEITAEEYVQAIRGELENSSQIKKARERDEWLIDVRKQCEEE